MRALLIGLVATLGTTAFAQATDDVFLAIGRKLDMRPNSVRAMMRRQGTLEQVALAFPNQFPVEDSGLIVGEEALALAGVILQTKTTGPRQLVHREPVMLPAQADPDALLIGTVAEGGRTYRVVCAAVAPGRTHAAYPTRPRLLAGPSNQLGTATLDAGTDDEVLRQVHRLIKEMQTGDYVCHVGG